jgi:hypothetical protein
MTRRRTTLIMIATACALTAPCAAQLHQTDVILRVNEGRVQTGGFPAPGTLVFPLRRFIATFGDSGIPDRTTNPGFQSVSDEFPGGSVVNLRLTAALRVWDGDDFLSIPVERMTVRKDATTITTPLTDPVPPESGPNIAVGISDGIAGDFHEHPGYRLLNPAGAGLYLLTGVVWVNTPDVAPSEPIYVVFRQNFSDQAELDEALAWIDANLIGGSACPADWNEDGVVNSTDVSDFINDWFTDQVEGTLVTDFNGDGVSNSTDVSDFINGWFTAQVEGC